MLVKDRKMTKENIPTTYLDIKSLYSNIPRDIRMHMYRVSIYAQTLFKTAKAKGVWDDSIPDDIMFFSEKIFQLHDIGRHYISANIYNKVQDLTIEEREEIKRHTIYALEAEKSVFLPIFPQHIIPYFRDVAVMHHERYDGQGYPYGKKGEDIPFMASVCAIADAYDGMVSWKTYRKGMQTKDAMEIIKQEAGKQFQAELVECFIECRNEIERTGSIINIMV